MTPRTLLSAAVCGLVVLGCAYPWPRVAADRECVSDQCEVKVTVLPGTTGPCIPDVDVGRVIVDPGKSNPNAGKVIFWEFASGTTNAQFPADGIVFAADSGFQCVRQGQGERFMCNNARSSGPWKYSVNVVSNGARCEELDPYVVNP